VASARVELFKPREAVRMRGGRGGGGRGAGPQYPPVGAMIDYYLASAATEDVTMQVLDATGKVVRSFTSAAPATPDRATAADAAPADDEEGGGGGRGGRGGSPRLDKTAGMHRFTWDLRYPGPANGAGVEGGNGPAAVPGTYAVRVKVGTFTQSQPLTVVEDPRVLRDGVTLEDLRAQFAHNMHVRDLVTDANKTVARLRAAQQRMRGATGADAEKLTKLNELASHMLTPSVRYSQPELVTHITYLYSMTNSADQKVGKDAIERFQVLRKALDDRKKELDRILGPAM
jgi:hypothetical protein